MEEKWQVRVQVRVQVQVPVQVPVPKREMVPVPVDPPRAVLLAHPS
jgi:hypothetical protein